MTPGCPTVLGGVDTLAVDLDGTALSSAGHMTMQTAAALNAAIRRGVSIIFVSARPLWSLRERTTGIHVQGPAVACGGAVMVDSRDRLLDRCPLSPSTVQSVLDAVAAAGASALCYRGDAVSAVGDSPVLRAELRITARHAPGAWTGGDADKVVVFAACDDPVVSAVTRLPGTFTARSHGSYLEVTATGADKGRGLDRLLHRLHLHWDRLAAVGDGDNDVPMLRLARHAFAVANATEQARLAADVVVPSNDDGGVADVIARLLATRGGAEAQ
jgi:hydroxymethylpyrimidine pyrophosphatase-like HAD family hydrolase